MIKTEMTTLLQQELKGLSSSLADDDYINAISAAERDTGWSMPQTSDFKIKWLLERSKRHLFFYLLSESASKFRYKDIHLHTRFDHYRTLVSEMDKEFALAIEGDPYQFADVSAFAMMGSKIDAGFQYEPQTGRETTFDKNNTVIITPNENS